MQANIETLGALERRLSVVLPQEKIASEIASRLKRISKTAKQHGFRPGKVPFKVVEQQYGPQVHQEVLSDALQQGFSEAVRELKLRVAGYPRFEPKSSTGPVDAVGNAAAQIEFSATFEVYPEVVLGDMSALTIERPLAQVDPADVDKTLEVLRRQRVRYEAMGEAMSEAASRPAASGDRINIDYRGSIDAVEFAGGKAENFTLVLGSGQLLPDFEAPVIGMRSGEEKSFELTFPADYHGKEVAGKTAQFVVKLNSVEAPVLPEVDAEFAKSMGVADGDVAKMRAEIMSNLVREMNKRVQAKLKDAVMQALLDATQLEAPKAVVEQEVQRLMQDARRDLERRGMKVKDLPLPPDLFVEQAKRRVNLGLILAELVKQHDLHATSAAVRDAVTEAAQSYEYPAEVISWYYAEPGRLAEMEALVLEENVVAWVASKAKVTDKRVSFDELMGKST